MGDRHMKWYSKEELEFLLANKDGMSVDELAERLGRTPGSVYRKLRTMGDEPKAREHYHGCDFKCYTCKYSDCLAPPDVCKRGYKDWVKALEPKRRNVKK